MSDLKGDLRRLRSQFNREVREGKLQDPAVAKKWILMSDALSKRFAEALDDQGSSPRLDFLLASFENFQARVLEVRDLVS